MSKKQKKASAPEPAHRITRKDVAAAAGVSLTTVTHVLNQTAGTRIHPDTRQRVMHAAKRLGYRPSFLGQALSQGSTGLFGILLPTPGSVEYNIYTKIIHVLVSEMHRDNKHLILLFRDETPSYANLIQTGALEGMFILQSDTMMKDIHAIATTGLRTVVINKYVANLEQPNLGMVQQDHVALGRLIVERFAAQGCTRLVFFHDASWCDANILLQQGFEEGLAAYSTSKVVKARTKARICGTVVTPDTHDPEGQLARLFSGKTPYDGFYGVGARYTEMASRIIRTTAQKSSRKITIISSYIDDTNAACATNCLARFWHNPAELGKVAWQVMQRLPQEDESARRILLPYEEMPIEEVHSPVHHSNI